MSARIAYLDRLKDTTVLDYQTTAPIIAVVEGEFGFYPIYSRLSADELNEGRVINKEAAFLGSMFGWDCPGAKGAFGDAPG